MFSDYEKQVISDQIRRAKLNCMVEFDSCGIIKLLDTVPIDISLVLKAFPNCRVTDYGQRLWDIVSDDVKSHFYVDIVLIHG